MVGGGGRRRSSPLAGLGWRWLGWVLRGRALAVGMLSFSSLSCCPQYQPLHDEVSHATGRHFHVRVGGRNTLASTSSGLVIHLGRHVDSRARSPRISVAAASAFAAARPTLVTQSSATCSPGRPSLTPAPLCVVSVRARPSRLSVGDNAAHGGCRVGRNAPLRWTREDPAADPVLCGAPVGAEVAVVLSLRAVDAVYLGQLKRFVNKVFVAQFVVS